MPIISTCPLCCSYRPRYPLLNRKQQTLPEAAEVKASWPQGQGQHHQDYGVKGHLQGQSTGYRNLDRLHHNVGQGHGGLFQGHELSYLQGQGYFLREDEEIRDLGLDPEFRKVDLHLGRGLNPTPEILTSGLSVDILEELTED